MLVVDPLQGVTDAHGYGDTGSLETLAGRGRLAAGRRHEIGDVNRLTG